MSVRLDCFYFRIHTLDCVAKIQKRLSCCGRVSPPLSCLLPSALASLRHRAGPAPPSLSKAGPAPCPINTHKSFTCCTHQRQLFFASVEICHRSEPLILHLGVLRLTFATAKNVMNFLNTAVDLLLRGRGATRDTCLPSSV